MGAALKTKLRMGRVLTFAPRTIHAVASTKQAAKLESGAGLLDKC